ncbi:aminopeptidase [Marivirga arenosa]|uniref:Aminopeptidase n=1 Tax=Marivirga arenosa TaxID=3059076 RepID=A0AA51NA00_9BACT|nr:aminopeptidase [Marivirga sp. ABR2-2]WMN07231.1 aminopeptidase [Marivirga sp. ABR2-2]
MKSVFRKIILITFIIISIFLIWKWKLVVYGYHQAKGQLSIMYYAEPLDNYLTDKSYPDSLKSKIQLVKKVKEFAQNSLGFEANGQYEKMYDQKGKELMWVVTAALPYQLENYEWKFPVLGKVAYKGFFIKEEAEKLEKDLRHKGYDTRLRTAGAWSTLGWLNDPLLSNVLNNTDGRLIELILHELTHDEVFIRDSIDFNENLASFFGQEFTKLYFKEANLTHSEEYKNYLDQLEDRHLFNRFINNYLNRFENFYRKIEGYSIVQKENLKYQFIEKFKKELSEQPFKNVEYKNYVQTELDVNNAFLLSYKRYSGNYYTLKKQLEESFNGDILKMLNYYQNNFNSL